MQVSVRRFHRTFIFTEVQKLLLYKKSNLNPALTFYVKNRQKITEKIPDKKIKFLINDVSAPF